jgi:predicted glycosyltransferase
VPRRHPRTEQAIRATRLQALGLADVVQPGADPAEVATLLREGPRHLVDGELEAAGIDLGGAEAAARLLLELATTRAAR